MFGFFGEVELKCQLRQWVLENCFPCGTIDSPNLKDIKYVQEMPLGSFVDVRSKHAVSPADQCPRAKVGSEERVMAFKRTHLDPHVSKPWG